jgi:hypothetical protein
MMRDSSAARLRLTKQVVAVTILGLFLASCGARSTASPPGYLSPPSTTAFTAIVEGSPNFNVNVDDFDKSTGVTATITYTGTCDLAQAVLRLAYQKGTTVVSEASGGVDPTFDIGPLAPNEPDSEGYATLISFTPDIFIFRFSEERCA